MLSSSLAQDPLQSVLPPFVDGIFRAISEDTEVPTGQVVAEGENWAATVDVEGDVYRAYFQSSSDAQEALHAVVGCM